MGTAASGGSVQLRAMTESVQDRARVEQFHPFDVRVESAALAARAGNPFLVELRAVVEGPEGRRTAVPGFYDGDGVWVVRVCPNVVGTWRYEIESAEGELAG